MVGLRYSFFVDAIIVFVGCLIGRQYLWTQQTIRVDWVAAVRQAQAKIAVFCK